MKTDVQVKTIPLVAKALYILSGIFLILSITTIVIEINDCDSEDTMCGMWSVIALYAGGGITIALLILGFVAQKFAKQNEFVNWILIIISLAAVLVLIFAFKTLRSEGLF